MVKYILIVSQIFLFAISSSANEPLLAPITGSESNQIAALSVGHDVTAHKSVRRQGKKSSLSDDASLSRALELPESDIYVADDASDGFAEFETKIPNYELPNSDIPLTLNSKVRYFISFFQNSGRTWFAKWLSRSERYIPMMKDILKKEGMPEDLVYVAMIESGFSPNAYSRASAVGPWQFIAGTGKRYSLRIDKWIDERRDPLKSTVAAALYLKDLYGMFNKDWYLAAAGYNAGENKIIRAIGMYNSTDFWQLSRGSYLKRETKDYVPKLLAAAIIAKDPAKYGFADIAYLPPIEFDTVAIPSPTDLELVARLIDVPHETIRDLNPELRRWCTPPDFPGYELKIPKGKKDLFLSEFAKIPEVKRFTEKLVFVRYRAKKGDTLVSIARHFGATTEEIATANNLSNSSKLRGKILRVPMKSENIPSVALPSKAPSIKNEEDVKKDKPIANTAVANTREGKELVKYYTIKPGDTLDSVAKRFNVSSKIIAIWNNLKGRIALIPGNKLIVAKYSEVNGQMLPYADEKG